MDQVAGLGPLLFSVVLVAVLCIVFTRMAATAKLDRNGSAGIRTKHTTASDPAWRAGHAAVLPVVYWIGVLAGVTVLAAIVAQLSVGGSTGIWLGLANREAGATS